MTESYPKKKEIEGRNYEKCFTGSSKQVDQYLEDFNIADNYYYRTFKEGHVRHLYLRPKLTK